MYRTFDTLFHGGHLSAWIREQLNKAVSRVDAMPTDQFLNAAPDTVIDHIVSEFHLEPLSIHRDKMTLVTSETRVQVRPEFRSRYDDALVEVPGVLVVVDVPFSGDAALWQLQPNQWTSTYPRGRVISTSDSGGILQIHVERCAGSSHEEIRQHIEENLRSIESYASWQAPEIASFNSTISNAIRQATTARRTRLAEQNKLVLSLGIPLKRATSAPSIETLPMKRRLVRPLPPAPSSGFQPEPGISDSDYEFILKVIRHEARTFETTSRTYLKLEEEELRNILLAHLNGHYEGDATGETFRHEGKTDIRIEDRNRAAFVAECKVWGGEKRVRETIDQLLGYLTWRDCKAAVVFFNKTVAAFGELVSRVPAMLTTHSLFRDQATVAESGEWRCRFVSKDDPTREVIVHVFLFNLYQKKDA